MDSVAVDDKRTFIGKFVHSTWTNMNLRCGKYKHLQTESKNIHYKTVKILFSRIEYKNWCYSNKKIIEILTRPSIDRINKDGNYSLDNIQIIELSENIRKDKTVFTEFTGTCFSCHSRKNLLDFCKDKRRFNGRTNICKPCESKRKKKIFHEQVHCN